MNHPSVQPSVPSHPASQRRPSQSRRGRPARRWPWLVAAALLAGGGAAWHFQQAAPLPEVQVAQIERGTLTRTVTGTGQARSEGSSQLRFAGSGKVSEVLVQVGDEVRQGDLLARLDTAAQEREIEAALAAARASRAEVGRAQAEVQRARGEVERLRSELPKAQAEVTRAGAEVERARGERLRAQEDITKAEAEVQRARAELTRAQQAGGEAQRERQRSADNARRALDGARAGLSAAQERLDLQAGLQQAGAASAQEVRTARSERDEAARKVQQAQADLSQALSASPAASSAGTMAQAEAGLRVAEAGLVQARTAARSTAGVQQAEAGLVTARTGVQQAQLAVRQAENAVQQALAGLQQAQANLAAAQLKVADQRSALGDLKLYAPASGVISAVNIVPGAPQPTEPAIELTDPAQLYLEVAFDETRSPDLRVGQPAQVRFDALPGTPLAGRVQRIDPAAQTTGQVARLKTRIALDTPQQVRPGYTAQATVTTLQREGAVLVPLETTREKGGTVSVWTLKPVEESRQGAGAGHFPQRGTAHQVTIKVEARSANQAAVSGVQPGEWLITPYPEELTEGQPVQAAFPPGPDGAAPQAAQEVQKGPTP